MMNVYPPPGRPKIERLRFWRELGSLVLIGTAVLLRPTAALSAAPTGIYIMVDPYSQNDLSKLNAAAQSGSCSGAEPFCSDSNGILLSIDWCRWQGYPDTSAPNSGGKDYSCHYVLGTNGETVVQQLPPHEDTHACAGSIFNPSFDICAASDLSVALSDIIAINQIRSSAGGKLPLHLSVGLMAGAGTPESYLRYEVGTTTAALPIQYSSASQEICGFEPLVWDSTFLNDYLNAYDQLLSFVHTQMSSNSYGSSISLVKITSLNASTLEYFLPGLVAVQSALTDPQTPDVDDVALNCNPPVGGGAQQWISAYPSSLGSSQSIVQAMEQTFGTTVGTLETELQSLGETHAYLSLATNNGSAYPQINCGLTPSAGTGTYHTCSPQSYTLDQWSTYYFEEHVVDLFESGSVANSQLRPLRMGPFR